VARYAYRHAGRYDDGLWFRASPQGRTSVTGIPAFFHRLDAVRGWNRTLGPGGFRQYQFAVPLGAEKVLAEVIETLQRHRAAAFLGTLKRIGPGSGNYLSFPQPGWSLAVDLPAGRDAFAAMYPDLDGWRAARSVLDPAGRFGSDLGRRLGLVDL
jgi:decaprenylphospho-beta-D-ribofuranose 2-oxidase